jgi:hypothetical protein
MEILKKKNTMKMMIIQMEIIIKILNNTILIRMRTIKDLTEIKKTETIIQILKIRTKTIASTVIEEISMKERDPALSAIESIEEIITQIPSLKYSSLRLTDRLPNKIFKKASQNSEILNFCNGKTSMLL